jgi:hypothetical protein
METLRVYPNPANDHILVDIPSSGCDVLEIRDISGRLVHQEYPGASSCVELNLESLEPGIYLLLLKQGQHSYHAPFVKE